MARLFVRDARNRRRLVVPGLDAHTLRGYATDDARITVTVEWGTSPTPTGKPGVMSFTATQWPGGALLSRVVRPWRRGGDWHACWNETRRQVRDTTGGIDIGEPPHAGREPGVVDGEDVADDDAADNGDDLDTDE
jgi:hypothetical protein